MVRVQKSTAHGDKLTRLLENSKLPTTDYPRVQAAVQRYKAWIAELDATQLVGDDRLQFLINKLNEYKNYIDLELIFDSEEDFLYRQKGQLKLDNTVLEEFLPRLFDESLVPGFRRLNNIECGPKSSFAGLSFESPFLPLTDGGAFLKKKDQDFSVTKSHKIVISQNPPTSDSFLTIFDVSYFATEIKTNLDKTMFQEASQTASELKRAVSGCKYILLCEWLDMTPISTKLTSIDEVIILRKAKRLSSNIRENFSTAQGRRNYRTTYANYLANNPLSIECFKRFIAHLNECFPDAEHDQANVVLSRGYF